MRKEYNVTLPIAGHAYVTVEADIAIASEEDAIDKALFIVESKHLESWEALTRFHQGNVSHCPTPWEAEAELVDDE